MYNEAYRTRMSEKLGLIDTDQDILQLDIYFTDEAKTLLENLFKVMATCGSDFTNTFRDLSKITKNVEVTEEDEKAIQALQKHSAPKEGLLLKTKHRFEDNPQVLMILATKP